jgi:hypothetical protein
MKMKKDEREELEAVIHDSSSKALGLEIAWRIVMTFAINKFAQGMNEEAYLLRDVVAKEIEKQWRVEHTIHIKAYNELYSNATPKEDWGLRL